MAEDTILELMVSHHALIESLFVLFRDEAREKSARVENSLSELKWEIKKHFFIEENAIFDFLPLRTMAIYKKIMLLKEEHISMIGYLEKFTADLPNVKDEDMESFHKVLEGHHEVEEKELYPVLDKEIRSDQKHQIIYRINEVPININLKK